MRSDIKMQRLKTSLFKYEDKLVSGKDMFDWAMRNFPSCTEDTALRIGQDFLLLQIISQYGKPKENAVFEPKENFYYQFQQDKPSISENMVIYNKKVQNFQR